MKGYKTVLITGCSSGIGEACALIFARAGFDVIASMRMPRERGKKLREIAEKEKLLIETPEIDVTDEKTIETTLSEINRPVDILINNAGFGMIGPVEDFTIEEIKSQYDTNVLGTLRMIKSVAPSMRKRRRGLIVNLSSINGLIPFPLWGVYSSSKFAIESLSESLRFELKHFGIDVVLIEPGSFLTNFPDNIRTPSNIKGELSDYEDLRRGFYKRYYKSREKAAGSFLKTRLSPKHVANLIFKISKQDNPRLRYRIGLDASIMYFFSWILPDQIKNLIFRKVYKW